MEEEDDTKGCCGHSGEVSASFFYSYMVIMMKAQTVTDGGNGCLKNGKHDPRCGVYWFLRMGINVWFVHWRGRGTRGV